MNKSDVVYQNSFPILEKGALVNLEEKFKNHILLADTGGDAVFLEKYSMMKQGKIMKNIDDIYMDAIKTGAIDHHAIDSFFAEHNIVIKKCSSKMVFDYKETILRGIKKYKIKNVETHKESDFDAIVSSYLLQSLIQHGELPIIAEELVEIVNRLDYGQFNESADVFFRSVVGVFVAVKNILASRGRKALGKEVFANLELKTENGRLNTEGRRRLIEIRDKYENLRNFYSFEILNKANQAKKENEKFTLLTDMPLLQESYSEELKEIMEEGLKLLFDALKRFEAGFRESEIFKAIIKDKEEKEKDVNILLSSCSNPTIFTNFAYSRTEPKTIVAVYREEKGIGIEESGDQYNVGIKIEEVDNLNLIGIWQALNIAEKKKRDEIHQKPESERNSKEKNLIDKWEGQRVRKFIGLEDLIVLKKDPVALVAGNSLIAAPRTALLSKEEFFEVLKSFKKKN